MAKIGEGLIGLRVVANEPDRFSRVAMGNTGLPYNPDTPQDVIDKVKAFRESDVKLTVMSMQKEVSQMDGQNLVDDQTPTSPALKFMYWQKFCWDTVDLPIGFLMSNMMAKNSMLKTLVSYFFLNIGLRKLFPLNKAIDQAYEAPFPNPSYKMGPRAMPSHVPTIPDESLDGVRQARELFKKLAKTFFECICWRRSSNQWSRGRRIENVSHCNQCTQHWRRALLSMVQAQRIVRSFKRIH